MTRRPRRARLRLRTSLIVLLLTFVTPSAQANRPPLLFGTPSCHVTGLVVDQAGAVADADGRFTFTELKPGASRAD
jgi:hypothetical protein